MAPSLFKASVAALRTDESESLNLRSSGSTALLSPRLPRAWAANRRIEVSLSSKSTMYLLVLSSRVKIPNCSNDSAAAWRIEEIGLFKATISESTAARSPILPTLAIIAIAVLTPRTSRYALFNEAIKGLSAGSHI